MYCVTCAYWPGPQHAARSSVLRATSGCVLSQSAVRMQWLHDAVVLPPSGARRSRSVLAGASELVVFVAEMEAHRLVSFASRSEVEEDGGLVS